MIEFWQRLKGVEKRVEVLERPSTGTSIGSVEDDPRLEARVKQLEESLKDLANKYRMLNARVARK